MIWLSRKEEFKRIILTLNPYNLEFIGVFNFIVRDKKIIKLHGNEIPQFCLFLSTETGIYGSTVTVSRKNYNQAKVEEPYGLCGVIRNTKHDDFILVTENINPATAIKQAVQKSWAKLVFIIIICGLCLCNLLLFVYAALHFSWG